MPESAAETLRELWKEEQQRDEEMAALQRRTSIAETEKAEAVAKLKTMEVQRESGNYVELETAQRDGADAAERVLGVLRAIPHRVAVALECPCQRAAVVKEKISVEVERAVAELHESLYMRPRGTT